MSWIERAWYSNNIAVWIFLPITLIFWALSALRRQLFKKGLKKSYKLDATVIVVGNITVGGNGKTPLVIRLCEWLRQQGYYPGVVSRGYGGNGKDFPISVMPDSDPAIVGDEPVLIRQRLGCPLVVDPNRVRGGQHLIDQHKCNVIVCDDGLQHYRLQRDVEIAVVDGERQLGNGFLLPMGPLREGKWRLKTVDFVVLNGGTVSNGEELMSLEPGRLVNIKYPDKSQSVTDLRKPVVALAAIGNPKRFFDLLAKKGVKVKQQLSFQDHHLFTEKDIPKDTVLMTEKDAVKCKAFAHDDWWYLPVSAKLTERFRQELLNRMKRIHKK